MKGLLACGGDAYYDHSPVGFDPDYPKKERPYFLDDQQIRVYPKILGEPVYIFDRDEYLFCNGPTGRGAP